MDFIATEHLTKVADWRERTLGVAGPVAAAGLGVGLGMGGMQAAEALMPETPAAATTGPGFNPLAAQQHHDQHMDAIYQRGGPLEPQNDEQAAALDRLAPTTQVDIPHTMPPTDPRPMFMPASDIFLPPSHPANGGEHLLPPPKPAWQQ